MNDAVTAEAAEIAEDGKTGQDGAVNVVRKNSGWRYRQGTTRVS